MRLSSILVLVFVLSSSLWLSSVQAAPEVTSSNVGKDSTKVERFLEELRSGSSPEKLAEVLKRSKFSERELQQLAQKLEEPAYIREIDRLKRQAARATHAKGEVGHIVAKKRPSLAKEQRNLALQRKRAIDQANREVRAMVRSLGSETMMQSGAPRLSPKKAVPSGMRASASVPLEGGNARITDFDGTPIVGGQITIRGTGFGRNEGRVAILVEDEMEFCEISSWRRDRIVATIPQVLQPARDELRHDGSGWLYPFEAVVWVKLYGGEIGPTATLGITPDITPFLPEILSVHPTEVSPGSEILIEGSNFFEEERPLQLEFGRYTTLRLHPLDWADRYIRARVEDLPEGGLQRMETGILRLRTVLGREASKAGITFVPDEEIVEFEAGPLRAICEPRNVPLLCLIGKTNKFVRFDELSLADGWVVHDSWLDEQNGQGRRGAYFERQPESGSRNTRAEIAVWVNAYAITEYKAFLTLKGPKGTDYIR